MAQLQKQGVDTKKVWSDVHKQVAIVLQALAPILIPQKLGGTYHILGFDFMLDADHTMWYLEVNSRPSFKLDGPTTTTTATLTHSHLICNCSATSLETLH